MSHYVDGFVLPIPGNRLDDYRQTSERVAVIWKEHGALDYREYVGDDLEREGTRPFHEFSNATSDQVIIFDWVVFESREARDIANERVAADPRMTSSLQEGR